MFHHKFTNGMYYNNSLFQAVLGIRFAWSYWDMPANINLEFKMHCKTCKRGGKKKGLLELPHKNGETKT